MRGERQARGSAEWTYCFPLFRAPIFLFEGLGTFKELFFQPLAIFDGHRHPYPHAGPLDRKVGGGLKELDAFRNLKRKRYLQNDSGRARKTSTHLALGRLSLLHAESCLCHSLLNQPDRMWPLCIWIHAFQCNKIGDFFPEV